MPNTTVPTPAPSPQAVLEFAQMWRGLGQLPASLRLQVMTSEAMGQRAAAAMVDLGTLAGLYSQIAREANFERLGLSPRDVEALRRGGLTDAEIAEFCPEPGGR